MTQNMLFGYIHYIHMINMPYNMWSLDILFIFTISNKITYYILTNKNTRRKQIIYIMKINTFISLFLLKSELKYIRNNIQ